ncbi:flagellar biosynthesis anti-sigma factor FlgM [Halomonas sp. FeN2]|uniref:flagellar biosynthesis anti-sigma factor FlgM n=1 Tax=Halomonas sp. FeN2 TaxID=2832500 RepID=UPI000C68C668|nr:MULTISPECIES: flagellar biosynthesis anti-sigma factor FlgM [unclassified Halomonas]MBF59018.1 flagellar biosynthesis anti-sigma factor FlgM [Halomonas sp.]UBR48091.1 flagellar biosynthesis anti-sigma factor FlgM [Halomonas sp. FeN2]
MNIDNINSLLRSNQAQQRDETQKASSVKPAAPGGATRESTQLSQTSTDESQDIDSAKVEEIRDAIREGRLEMNADRIADGLIANLKDF